MWRKLINDVKNADDIEEIVNNYIEKRKGIETINKLRNIVDEDEISEDKKCKIIKILIKILIKNIDREIKKIKKEIDKEKIMDLINISRRGGSVSKFQLESMLSKESLTKAVYSRGKVFMENFICSTLEDGKTLLDKAAEKDLVDVAKILIENGASVDKRLLALAIEKQNADMIRLLIKRTDIDYKNDESISKLLKERKEIGTMLNDIEKQKREWLKNKDNLLIKVS